MKINEVYQGNCVDVMTQFSENAIDLTVTSPPYDNLRDYKGYSFDFESIAKELYRVTKSGGVVVWIVNDAVVNGSETGTSFRQALYFMSIGFKLHDTMIWQKPTFTMPQKNRYHQVFEYMFIFVKGKLKTFNPLIDRENKFVGKSCLGSNSIRAKDGSMEVLGNRDVINEYGKRFNVWKIKTSSQENPCKKIDHPATFSEELVHDHILSWSNQEDIVLDPMCGSGTVLKMARRLNRNFIGIDISEEYCKLSRKRINEGVF